MTSLLKLGALGLLAAALAGSPAQLLAQTTNNPTATKKAAVTKKDAATKSKAAHPFHGKLAAVDKIAKTIKVGSLFTRSLLRLRSPRTASQPRWKTA